MARDLIFYICGIEWEREQTAEIRMEAAAAAGGKGESLLILRWCGGEIW
jgi:hypothetical protein